MESDQKTQDAYYTSRYVFDSARAFVWKEIVRFEKRFIPDTATVVDLGAGYCDFINIVSAQKKYAVDTSPELTTFAGEGVQTIGTPAWDLGLLSDGSVDIVHASNLFEHFTDEELELVMSEIKRVLKKGGKLILMQPNYRLQPKHYFDDPTHKKVFSDAALRSFLVSYGMAIVLGMPRFLPFSMRSNSSLLPLWLLPYVVRLYIYIPVKPFAGQMLFVAER